MNKDERPVVVPVVNSKKPVEKKIEWKAFIVALVVFFGVYGILQVQTVQDWIATLSYRPDEDTAALEEALELTGAGARLWAATWPVVEEAESFNAHCDSFDEDVSVLGCYAPDEDKIYIYEIAKDELEDAMRTTAAHELLHANWARMSNGAKKRVEELLNEVYAANQAWFDEELEAYEEAERLEEMYTRAGTKLNDLPEKLEQHYAEIFTNRAAVVKYYENYQEVFDEIQEKMDTLNTKMTQLSREIETGRTDYHARSDNYNAKVDQFNVCADTTGCFTEASFNYQRNLLMVEEAELETMRLSLNTKIEQYNQLVEQYQEYQATRNELYDGMNSNVKIEAEE